VYNFLQVCTTQTKISKVSKIIVKIPKNLKKCMNQKAHRRDSGHFGMRKT
jgi:hypothetical protein